MKTAPRSLATLALFVALALGASSACQVAPDDEGSAEQAAQDLAWGYARDARSGAAHFLVQNGAGSLSETNTYYGSIIEQFAPNTLTLPVWQSQFINGPTVGSYYRNKNELGFWRDMTCTTTIRRGVGGCMVTNYKNETDKAQHLANLGTVAMTVSPEGFARFYVFLPNGVLSPSALLDDEGPKFAPRLCTVCHSGASPTPGTNPDLGSIFREFEPTLLQAQTGLSRPEAEAQLFALNEAIRTANQSIRSEAEGSPAGVDHAKAAMSAHLDELYPDLAPPARPLTDPALIPVSWQADPTNAKLWTAFVAPYCMSCHRHNRDDWATYGNFAYLQDTRDGAALLRQYISGVGSAHPYPFMPQAELTYTRLATDSAAQAAINAWIPCSSGDSCVPTNSCHKGTTSCQTGASVCTDTGTALPDGTACGDHGTCSHGRCRGAQQQCNTAVLLLADADSSDATIQALSSAMTSAGLQPTVMSNGTISFPGTTLSSSSTFGAILVAPGRTYQTDMDLGDQQAIAKANAEQGTGVVFTEWSAYEVTAQHFAQLAPLMLLERAAGSNAALTFKLTADSHPIWTGLPSSFATTIALDYSTGTAINGGVQIAALAGGADTTPGVLVRESQGSAGRIVQIGHAANYTPGWTSETNAVLMLTNALRWSAHCL